MYSESKGLKVLDFIEKKDPLNRSSENWTKGEAMKRCVRTKHLSGVDHSSEPLKRLYEIVFKNADRVDKKLILLRTRE